MAPCVKPAADRETVWPVGQSRFLPRTDTCSKPAAVTSAGVRAEVGVSAPVTSRVRRVLAPLGLP